MSLHGTLFSKIVEWARTPRERRTNALFLYGAPGIGKTTLAHAALETAGYRVVEWNASQHRHRAAVEESLLPLLNSRNVSDFFRPEGPRNLGIVLDEIDGMSVGDKGGMTELIKLLKEYRGENAIICISNEWMEKKFQPFMKLCLSFAVIAPTKEDIASLLRTQFSSTVTDATILSLSSVLLEIHSGDLRKILQTTREVRIQLETGKMTVDELRRTILDSFVESHALSTNRIRRAETIKTAVGQLLRGQLDMLAEIPLTNNDLNLAGLHLHESLPKWLSRHIADPKRAYQMYRSCFKTLVASDRLDYYTFFFQHWTLFPLTYQAKLQGVNQILFGYQGIPIESARWKDEEMDYTAVLAKQSMLYNQFRYLCEMRDLFIENDLSDDGFDSTVWTANLLMKWARGKTSKLPWEAAEVWRIELPSRVRSPDVARFMRLLQSLQIPTVPAME
jgi:hypothetical protein